MSMTRHNKEIQRGILDTVKKIASNSVSALILMDNKELVAQVLDLSKMNDGHNVDIHELAVKGT